MCESNDRSCEASNEDRWGKAEISEYNSDYVIKYHYGAYPHCRKPGMIDLL